MNELDEGGTPTPDTALPDLYRREAKRLRRDADIAETIQMRGALLEAAEKLDWMAADNRAGQAG